ncbi:MAG: pyrophosphatase PpaX [Planifilum fulgidum]
MRYETVLFDLDGTLIDTNDLILASYEYTLSRHCPGKFSREEILSCLGEPLHDTMRRLDPEKWEAMVQTYREHNLACHDDWVKLFPGVPEVLEKLHRAGVALGVVSNKQRITVEKGLSLFGLDQWMKTVVCYGEAGRPKPHPDPILRAMEAVGADPDRTLMVGDSRFDLLAARRAGVDAAAVAWSWHGRDELLSLSPEYVLEKMEDLVNIVEIGAESGGG